jgi:hypothetical protein
MEAWAANNIWWLLPAIGLAVLVWRFSDAEGSVLHRMIYALWPSLEPGSAEQRRSVNNAVSWAVTVIIAAIVAFAVLLWWL